MNTFLFFLAAPLLLLGLLLGVTVLALYLFTTLVEAEYWDI